MRIALEITILLLLFLLLLLLLEITFIVTLLLYPNIVILPIQAGFIV